MWAFAVEMLLRSVAAGAVLVLALATVALPVRA